MGDVLVGEDISAGLRGNTSTPAFVLRTQCCATTRVGGRERGDVHGSTGGVSAESGATHVVRADSPQKTQSVRLGTTSTEGLTKRSTCQAMSIGIANPTPSVPLSLRVLMPVARANKKQGTNTRTPGA